MLNLESVCKTTDKNKPPCVFPFREKKKGTLHFKCAKSKRPRKGPWCALDVDSDHVQGKGMWEYCGDAKRCTGMNMLKRIK